MEVDIDDVSKVSTGSLNPGDTFKGSANEPLIVVSLPSYVETPSVEENFMFAMYLSTGRVISLSKDFKVLPIDLKVVRIQDEN